MPTNSLHLFVATNPGLEEQEQQEEKREEQEKEEEAAAEAEEEKEEVEKEEEKEEEILPTISSSRFGATCRRPSGFRVCVCVCVCVIYNTFCLRECL